METPRSKGMTNFEVDTLIKENKKMQEEIHNMLKKINVYKRKINSNETLIFDKCKHIWEYDPSCYMDTTKYYCKKCSLWRNRCWYT